MKKVCQVLCLAIGGILIGANANQLNTANGAALFTFGILLAVCSAITVTQKEKTTKKINPYKRKK